MVNIKSRMIAILAADGFDSSDLIHMVDALKRSQAHPQVVSVNAGAISGLDGHQVQVDKTLLTTGSIMFDAVYVPGGQRSVDVLKLNDMAVHFINEAFKHCKPIGASNEGVELLTESGIKGIEFADEETEGEVISEHGVLTVWSPGFVDEFVAEFIEAVGQARFWERELMPQVPA